MWKQFRNRIQDICHMLEVAAAALVLIGICLTLIGTVTNLTLFRDLLSNSNSFHHFLEQILLIVIGIEFLQMLCRPNSDNVIETLIFLVARHMIVGKTNPYEDFVSVISISLLCLLRSYLHRTKEEKQEKKAE